MFKKCIGYILLVSFINMFTTLPARCCEGKPVHQHPGAAAMHSHTVIQHIFNILGDDESADNNSIDVHHSVYHDNRKVSVTQQIQIFCKAGNTVSNAPVVAIINYTGYNTRQFTLPPHYNYLFRLTPF